MSPLWTPPPERVHASRMNEFMNYVNRREGTRIETYRDFFEWSVSDEGLPEFWANLWDYAGVVSSQPYARVVDDPHRLPGARWFPGARLNFAENLLRYRDDQPALIFRGEDRVRAQYSHAELYTAVERFARSLRERGLRAGDRVAGFMPNMPETIIAMLGATSLGGVWSSSSPDFGVQGVLDRFGQIEPRLLIAADGYFYKGKIIDTLPKLREIAAKIPSIETIVVVPYVAAANGTKPDLAGIPNAVLYEDFLAPADAPRDIEFAQLPFDHPVYIMYSSGTTGLPKCMVQGPGVLLNHLKEHLLHVDLQRGERIFYFTTCGWMMWNWLASALGVGATLILYDGNPFHPGPESLWQMSEELEIDVFGTSARYITALEEAGVVPAQSADLSKLRAVLSTGSPLPPEGFEYVYRAVKSDVLLASISGGTDLNGCFALGNPVLPVYSGEIQCRGLGMNVKIYDDQGRPVVGEPGELVCESAFPSMPLHFWNDDDGTKYHDAYFAEYANVWRHGDFAMLSERGGLVVLGRSDATLNPGGVRIGTADIYRIVEKFAEIEDSVVIGQALPEDASDVRVVLFVKMAAGRDLDDDLQQRLRSTIRAEASPRHVPAVIVSVPDVPYTRNMKKVELAVKRVVENRPVTNREALVNPECLEAFRDRPELQ